MFYSLPPTSKRVFQSTTQAINKTIRNQTIKNLRPYIYCKKKFLSRKIRSLNKEWDTERILETYAATSILISTILANKYNKRWLSLTSCTSFFLLMHALQGWCPPLPLLRYLGIRTPEEIYKEKMAIKFYRGDFPPNSFHPNEVLSAIEKE
jgi:hypothetical protein